MMVCRLHQAIIWTNADFFGNKFQWNFNQNTTIFIEENKFETVVCKLAAIFYFYLASMC